MAPIPNTKMNHSMSGYVRGIDEDIGITRWAEDEEEKQQPRRKSTVKGAASLIVVSHGKRTRPPFHHMRSEEGRKDRDRTEEIIT